MIGAVGVDESGQKHILGIEPGATENAASVKRLFTRLRDNGLNTEQRYLFVIDGSKALRAAIHEVFGGEQPIQRCSKHKERNVLNELPENAITNRPPNVCARASRSAVVVEVSSNHESD
jgi:putative transposase